jgi:thioredoxin reductase (NADPH)
MSPRREPLTSSDNAEPLEETPDREGAFPRLGDEQLSELESLGERRKTTKGGVLYRAGERNRAFFVVLEGLVAIVEAHGTDRQRVLGVHGPRRFLGELNLLIGQPAFVTAVVQEPGEVLAVPLDALRQLVTRDPALGDLILRAYLARRSILLGLGTGLRIIGSRHSPDTARLRELAARNRLPFTWIDLEEDRSAEALLRELGIDLEETPVLIVGEERVMRNPTNPELAAALGLPPPNANGAVWDVAIIGAGPAGLAASVYAASEGLETIVVDAVATGGQAATSSRIENYLGFPAGISGGELAERAVVQAERFGAFIVLPAEATGLAREAGHHIVKLDGADPICARAVLIATGAKYRKLQLSELERFESTSVHYAATHLEARLCVDDPVVIIGGGNSAGQATQFLCDHAGSVVLVVRENDLGEHMSRYLAERIERDPRVDLRLHSEVQELIGDRELEAVEIEDTATGKRERVPTRHMFVFIGCEPETDWVTDHLAVDDGGYILTGSGVSRTVADGGAGDDRLRLPLETSRPGLFAAGDVRRGSVKRVAAAVGEGAMAVRFIHERIRDSGGPRGVLDASRADQGAQTKRSSA